MLGTSTRKTTTNLKPNVQIRSSYTAGSWSKPSSKSLEKPLGGIERYKNLKKRFDTDKIKLEEYVQGMSTHTDVVIINVVLYTYRFHFLRVGKTPLFGLK